MKFKPGDIIKLEYTYTTMVARVLRTIESYSQPLYEVLTFEELQKVPYRWVPKNRTVILPVEYTDQIALYLGRNEKVVRTLYLNRPLNEREGP